MKKDRKQRLLKLGKDALVEALLDLADRDQAADDRIEPMIATPADNLSRFKSRLAALRCSKRFMR